MAQVIFNNRIDMVTIAATPSADGFTIGYDTDGVIKQKDYLGVVTPLFSSSSQNLIQTLDLGNDSGVYSIMMGTGTSIYSANSTAKIMLDYNDTVFIYATSSSTGTSSVYLAKTGINIQNSNQYDYGFLNLTGTTYSVEIGSPTGSLFVKQTKNKFWISQINTTALENPTYLEILNVGSNYLEDGTHNSSYVHINSLNATTATGVRNSVIIGGSGVTATQNYTVYLGSIVRISDSYNLPTSDGNVNEYMVTDGAGNVTWGPVVTTTAPLDQVLAVGNNSESYNIILGTGTSLRSGNGDSAIHLDSGSTVNKILISSDSTIKSKAYIEIDNSSLVISATAGTVTTGDLKGLQYSADYSSTFVNNSLITKQYVDSQLGNVFTTYKTAYVDPSEGSDITGLVDRVDKPYATVEKALSGLTSSYTFNVNDTGLIYLKKGLYTNPVYLYDNVNFYCESDVIFSQNGFTDINGAVSSSIFGYAKFLGTDATLIPLDVTKSSNINFEFSRIENQNVALKVTNTIGTSVVNMKGDYMACKSDSGKAILIGSNNGDADVSSNVNINIGERIKGAYNTISVTDKFYGTLEINTPLIECDSDFNISGPQPNIQHVVSVKSASASVRINGDLVENSSSNAGGINSAFYANGGTVSIYGNILGGECPGVYLDNSTGGNISIHGDIISKKESIINESNNIKLKVNDSLIKTNGLGANPYAININAGSMSSTYLHNTRIYNSLENSGVIIMTSTSSRFGIYNSIGYSAGTASGNFIYCTGTVSVGIHNTRSNKDNSDNVEDTFTPSGFIYDQNLYLGDF